MKDLVFFSIPKENLKINILSKDETELEKIKKVSNESSMLPDITKYYTDIYFPNAPQNRPYMFSSIVLSSDGKMAYEDNASGPLVAKNNFLDPDGSLGDFWVLNVLRALADGVIIGAKTLQSEPGITCHVYEQCLTNQREEVWGKKYQPCGIIASFDAMDIPFNHTIFNIDKKEEYKVLISTSPKGLENIKQYSKLKHKYMLFKSKEDIDNYDFKELYSDFEIFPVIVTGEDDKPDTELMMYALRKWGIEKLCIESPSYCMNLLNLEMLDEYFINYSMVFVGGKVTPGIMTPFSYLNHPHSDLLTLGIHQSNFIFTRQKIKYGVNVEKDLTEYKY